MKNLAEKTDTRNLLDGVDAPPGVTSLNLVIRSAPPPVVNIRDAAAICGSTTAAVKKFVKVARLSTGRVGKLEVIVWEDFVAAIRRLGAPPPTAPTSPGAVKTKLAIVKGKAPTAAEIAAANGFVVLAKGGDK